MTLLVQHGDPLLVWLVIMVWVHGAFCGGGLASHLSALHWAKYVLAERDKWTHGREWFESSTKETDK